MEADRHRTMKETLVRKIALANGLTLELVDASRKVASDRYRVELIERIHVPVDTDLFTEKDAIDVGALRATLGVAVVFEKRTERNFIDENKKDAVFDALVEASVTDTVRYYAHPDFARKFLMKTYRDALRRRRW